MASPHVTLARGWERQLDIANNPIFYTDGALTPTVVQELAGRQRDHLGGAPLRRRSTTPARARRACSPPGRSRACSSVWQTAALALVAGRRQPRTGERGRHPHLPGTRPPHPVGQPTRADHRPGPVYGVLDRDQGLGLPVAGAGRLDRGRTRSTAGPLELSATMLHALSAGVLPVPQVASHSDRDAEGHRAAPFRSLRRAGTPRRPGPGPGSRAG